MDWASGGGGWAQRWERSVTDCVCAHVQQYLGMREFRRKKKPMRCVFRHIQTHTWAHVSESMDGICYQPASPGPVRTCWHTRLHLTLPNQGKMTNNNDLLPNHYHHHRFKPGAKSCSGTTILTQRRPTSTKSSKDWKQDTSEWPQREFLLKIYERFLLPRGWGGGGTRGTLRLVLEIAGWNNRFRYVIAVTESILWNIAQWQ